MFQAVELLSAEKKKQGNEVLAQVGENRLELVSFL